MNACVCVCLHSQSHFLVMLIVCLLMAMLPLRQHDAGEYRKEEKDEAGPGRMIRKWIACADLRLQVNNIENVDDDRLIVEVNGLLQRFDWIFGGPEGEHDLHVLLAV